MGFYVIVVLTVLNHIAYKGSKMLISLYAIELGASASTIGILYSLYSFFSLFLALYAGRVSDRLGPRLPMLMGSVALGAGLLLPYLARGLVPLFISATLIGTLYIFYTVSAQHLIGAFGAGHERTRNYATFSLGVALTALLGPTTTGFLIDSVGHQATYLALSLFPLGPVLFLTFFAGKLPHVAGESRKENHRAMDLVRNAPLVLGDGAVALPVYFELGSKYPAVARLDRDGNFVGMTGQCLIDCIINNLLRQMVWACGIGIHAGTTTYRI